MKKELVVEWQHKFNTITKQSKKIVTDSGLEPASHLRHWRIE